jgi:type II secretory pathway pseudopilin PulG
MSGFTIIELMLFLAVGAGLFAALMIGVNGNITQEHYRQSVLEYASLIQDQYSEVLNPRNDRDDNWKCQGGAVSEQQGGGVARGTTNCVILGRAVQITDGSKIDTYAVIGNEPSLANPLSDIDTILAYHPQLSIKFSTTSTTVDWQSTLATITGQQSAASYLILRSPASGLLKVFAYDQQLPADLSAIVSEAAATHQIKNCVEGSKGMLPTQSVTVDPRVAGSNGVIINEADTECR